MDNDIFKAGVAFGGPSTQNEVKLLILFCLHQADRPLPFSLLHQALQENQLVNYFSLVEAAEQLVESGHLEASEPEGEAPLFSLSPLGQDAVRELEDKLPLSVRQKAQASIALTLKREQRRSELIVREKPEKDGYMLELAIPEEGGSLISFSVFAPTMREKERIKRCFLNDPAYIYKGVMALLTGDKKVLEDIFPQEELF